jgi:RimJ/RimL family protein N-acetyltransferase
MIRLNAHEHGHAIANAADCVYNPAVDTCISRVDQDGELLGGVIFTAYTGASVHLHMAGFCDHWANRDLIWCIFDYPFNQLGCKRVFGQVRVSNTKALEIDLKLGFKIVAEIDDVYPDGGVYVLSMSRQDCKWLSVKPRHIRSMEEA